MAKHVIDKRDASKGSRTQAFVRLERQLETTALHPNLRALHQRPDAHDSPARVGQFLRIARGQTA